MIVYHLFNASSPLQTLGFGMIAHFLPQFSGAKYRRAGMRGPERSPVQAGGEGVSLIEVIIYIYMYLTSQNLLVKGGPDGCRNENGGFNE